MWNTNINFEVRQESPHIRKRCELAVEFYDWTIPIMSRALAYPFRQERINQGILQVTRKYRELRLYAGREHINRVGDTGHVCIFHVWNECCRGLEAAEREIIPEPLYLPAPIIEIPVKELPDEEPPDILGEFTE